MLQLIHDLIHAAQVHSFHLNAKLLTTFMVCHLLQLWGERTKLSDDDLAYPKANSRRNADPVSS